MLSLIDLLNAAANQKEWKPLERNEKEKPIVLPNSTSYVNFLDKETPRKIIKEKEESKKKLTQIVNKSITTRARKEINLKVRCENIALELENIIKNKNA